MSKICLDFTHPKKLMLSDGLRPPLTLEQARLEIEVLLPNALTCTAVIDTGAPCTIISKSIWSIPGVQTLIDWLLFRPGAATPLSLPDLRVAGRQFQYRVGNISLQPIDKDGTTLPPRLLRCANFWKMTFNRPSIQHLSSD